MHHSIFYRCLCTLLTCVLLCCYNGAVCVAADQKGSTAGSETIEWLSYENGLARAKAQNKKTFIYFYTGRCPYCTMMEKKTLTDKSVIALLKEKFVCVRVNLNTSPSLGALYPVSGVPTAWFLESNGNKIGGRPGFIPAENFLEMLNFIVDEKYK